MPMFGAIDPHDKPFQRNTDLKAFTQALVSSGYWPYLLRRRDNGLVQTVWAKSEAEVGRYAEGEVLRQLLEDGYQVRPPIVVVLDAADGGHINVNGTHLSSQGVI